MIPRFKEIKSEVIRFCGRMDHKGWVANHDGNISVKLDNGNFMCTPTSRAKFDLVEDDLIEVDFNGKKISGSGAPFSELAMHLRAYAARPDLQAVVHAHPPSAMAVGCSNQEMVTWAVPEAVVSLGPGIPLVGLSLPQSDAMWGEYDSLLKHYDAVMIAGNGVFSWGKTLEQAFLRLELVEHLAKIFISSLALSGPMLLQADQIASLLKKRSDAGLSLPPDPTRPHWFPEFSK